MKKTATILSLLLVIPTLLTSCLFDEEDLFDKSASERIEAAKIEAKAILESAPNGWHVRYFPSPTREFGGYNVFFKFSEGSVTIASETEADPATAETSLYSLGEDLGVTLNFDTKNSVINYFVHPRNPDGLGSTYKGMEGDYKFTVVSTSPEEVRLRGIMSGNTYILTPVAADAVWADEIQTYWNCTEDMEFSTYSCTVKGKSYPTAIINRRFTIRIDDQTTVYAPFIYTKTGISFYEPITIDGVTARDLTFTDGYYFAEASGSDFKIMTPEPIRSDITFQATVPEETRTYNQVGVQVVPSNDTEYYYIGAMLKSEFEAVREKKLLQQLVGSLNAQIGAGDKEEDIAKMLYKGKDSYTMQYPSFYEEYVAVVFGCAISNGFISSTTSITSIPFSVDASLLPSNTAANYKRWLGKWRITSTSSQVNQEPVTFDIVVKPGKVNNSYMIRGWGITVYGNQFDLRAFYRSASYGGNTAAAIPVPKTTGALYTTSDNDIYGYDGVRPIRTRYSRITYSSGAYTSFTTAQTTPKLVCAYDEAQAGRAVMYGVSFNTGTDYTGIEFYSWTEDMGSYYTSPAVRPGYTAKDFPTGPFTWVQLVDAEGNAVSAE